MASKKKRPQGIDGKARSPRSSSTRRSGSFGAAGSVHIFKSRYTFEHKDARRAIAGAVGNLKFPFPIRQIKFVEFSAYAVSGRLVAGNHRFKRASGQWEIIVVLGKSGMTFFKFRHKNYLNDKVFEKDLRGGDIVVVPPGCTMAFIPLKKGARIIELSNKEYNSKNFVKEMLFN